MKRHQEDKIASPGGRRSASRLTTLLTLTLTATPWLLGGATCVGREVASGDGEAHISCPLRINVNWTGHSVVVKHFPPSSNHPETVLSCDWVDGEPDCLSSKGFTQEGELSDEIKAKVPQQNLQTTGAYLCQVVPPVGDDTVCSVTYKTEEADVTTHTESPVNSSATPDDKRRETLTAPSNQCSVEYLEGLMIVLVILVVLLLLLVVALVVMWVRFTKTARRMMGAEKRRKDPESPILEYEKCTTSLINGHCEGKKGYTTLWQLLKCLLLSHCTDSLFLQPQSDKVPVSKLSNNKKEFAIHCLSPFGHHFVSVAWCTGPE